MTAPYGRRDTPAAIGAANQEQPLAVVEAHTIEAVPRLCALRFDRGDATLGASAKDRRRASRILLHENIRERPA